MPITTTLAILPLQPWQVFHLLNGLFAKNVLSLKLAYKLTCHRAYIPPMIGTDSDF